MTRMRLKKVFLAKLKIEYHRQSIDRTIQIMGGEREREIERERERVKEKE